MTKIILGEGKFCVASAHLLNGEYKGCPTVTIRKTPESFPVGTLLENERVNAADCEVVLVVTSPEAAAVLLSVAQAVAFNHGLVQGDS